MYIPCTPIRYSWVVYRTAACDEAMGGKNIFNTLFIRTPMHDSYWEDFEEYEIPEIYEVRSFVEELASKVGEAFRGLDDKYHPAYLGEENSEKLYGLIRNNKPSTVIETGVCNGMSSGVILKALQDNNKGRLYSVDLPVEANSVEGRTGAVLPPGYSSGWVVPDKLRDRWELSLGNTYYELPKIFEKVSEIEVFIHDSGHSYDVMMFEFGIAWYHLCKGGFLLADNTSMNDAFKDFARAKKRKLYRLNDLSLLNR